jgi:hypothetical protein
MFFFCLKLYAIKSCAALQLTRPLRYVARVCLFLRISIEECFYRIVLHTCIARIFKCGINNVLGKSGILQTYPNISRNLVVKKFQISSPPPAAVPGPRRHRTEGGYQVHSRLFHGHNEGHHRDADRKVPPRHEDA